MVSKGSTEKSRPHAILIPFPAQGHINPMLELAKLLHYKGFLITFVNTEYNHRRLLKSRGPNAADGLPTFRFETIPDGLPPSDADVTQAPTDLALTTTNNCLAPLRELLFKINKTSSPVTCIIPDSLMGFALKAADELKIPAAVCWTASACGFMGYLQYRQLIDKGFIPLKDASYLTNGYLNTVIDTIPGMKDIRLKDLPSFVRTTDGNEIMLNFLMTEAERAHKTPVIINTFDALEHDVLEALSSMLHSVYTIGPFHLRLNQIEENDTKSINSNLWKDDPECLTWLDTNEPNSVVYVNYGSITVMTPQQLVEFSWGLANSNQSFLWIIRPDLVTGDNAILPPEFVAQTKGRGLLASWCPQQKVLSHPSIGGFLTHCGWNSTCESICAGVPMLCWPFFAEQQTNCWYCCTQLGIAMEIDNIVKRDEVESLVRELMVGEKGKEMKRRVMVLKKKAEQAITPSEGSSYQDFEKMVTEVLISYVSN